MDFSAAEKARVVKFCMRVGLLSGQVFSPLEIKGQGHEGQKMRLALRSPTRLPYKWYAVLQAVAAVVPADERISWRARGDIGGGVH